MNLHKLSILMRWSMLSFLMVSASFLTAQTQYIGPDNGDWLTAANWNNGLPAAGNNATIGGGAIVVINGTLTIDFSVNNFGTIANAGTTTISGSIIGGIIENRAGASMTFETGSQANINNGFNNAGTFTNKGALNINTVAWSNAATGIFNNEGSVESLVTATNNGTFSNKAGVFNAPQPFTNNKTIENLSGATWKVDFGGSYSNALGSTLTNSGAFVNLGTFVNNAAVNNFGTFTNNGSHSCNGAFNNENGARFESTATVNLAGTWNNKVGASVQNGFNFNVLAAGLVTNQATFQNNGSINISLGATFSNEAGGTVPMGFGSQITNAGDLLVKAASSITGNGTISNVRVLDISGTVDLQNGASLLNNSFVTVNGTLKNVNTVTNSGSFVINGIFENNSGGVFNNTASLTVNKPGRISNNFEVVNTSAATFINNGSVLNAVRIINEGAFTNNAYLQLTGDLMNKPTGNFNNTEVVEIRDGAIINEGATTNGKTIVVRACGIISNKSTITNNGRIENSGVVFQRGTIAANAIVNTGGYIHTGATSNAPSICKPTVRTGTDLNGDAKVDAPAVVAKGFGIDSCFGVQYFVEYVNRRTYKCVNVGQTITAPVTLRFRTNDSLTCTTQVTVFDGVAPIISNCPQDVTVLNTIDSARFAWQAITAVDNCGGTPTIASTVSSNSFFKVGTTEVIVTATDASANRAECRFKVTVARVNATGTCTSPDNTTPVFTNCPTNITLNSNTGIAAAAWNAPSVSDACYPITLRVSKSSGSLFFSGTTAVTYTATDANNNSATCTFNVTVNGPADICSTDNIKPIIRNCPPNFFGVSNAAINGAVSIWTTPSVSDNCGAVTLTASAQSGDIFPNNTTAVTYTATDAKGNSSTCTFNVFVGVDPCVGDVAGPVLTCPANVAVTTTTQTGIATWTAPTPTDACGGITLVGTHTSGSNFGLGETFVTYQASDRKGNFSTCAFKVTVTNLCFSDTTRPVFSGCPANIAVQTVGTSATATWSVPTATDNCGSATVTSNFQPGATFGLGTTNIIYTATDINGNSAVCQFTVTVTQNACLNDVTPPTFANCPTNRPAVTATAACGATVTWTAPTASDNCGTPTVVVTSSPTVGLNSGSCFPVGITTMTYRATDAKGLTATCSFTVTVNANACLSDVTPPTFANCPTNRPAVTATAACGATVTWTAPTASDNCGTPTVVVTSSPTVGLNSGSCFPVGVTTMTYRATDAKGLTATCNFTVTVNANACLSDVTPPTFANCPTNRPAVTATAACGATVTWTAPTASDNCGTPTVVVTSSPTVGLNSGSCFPVGITTMTYRATDAKGLTATCSFTVTVNANACLSDVTPPTFANCPTNRPAVTATAACGATVTWTAPTASDNCGTPTVVVTSSPTVGLNSGSCFPVGITTMTYRATDAKGLTATCSFTVTVNAAVNTGFDPNKCYRIINKHTGKALDLKQSLSANGTQIFQWTYNGTANQLWQIKLLSDGRYQIVSKSSGKLLDIVSSGGNCTNGVKTEQWSDDGSSSQRWRLVRQADGSYKMYNGTCNKTIKVEGGSYADGAPVELWDDFGAEYFKWNIQEAACPAPAPCITAGSIIVERWNNHTASNFPLIVPTTTPSVTTTQGNTQGAWNIGDNYFTRVRGYIRPQVSGNYTFNITGDDFSEFFLSTNNSPSTMTRRAYIQGWTSELEYTKYASQTSVTISLQANQYYYFEVRQKEFAGGDGWRLSWKTPLSLLWQPIQSQFLARPCNNVFQGLTTKETFAFDAVSDNGRAKLQWLSNTGYKNDYFVVERTNAQGTFEALDKQNAYTGDAELATYNFTDNNPLDGDNFYRINTVSNTGTPQYSAVKKVSISKANDINVYPNPAEEYLNIDLRSYEGKSVTVYLYNNLGKMVKKVTVEKASSAPQQVDIQEFNAGSYLVRIQSEGKRDVMKQVSIAK